MKKYLNILLVFLALVMAGCDSLEDTYKEFSGDGPIRYLGKCTNLTVSSGWKKLIVKWDNSPDPVINKVRLTWTKDGEMNEKLFDRDVDSCSILNLEDGNYEITVCSVDKEGNSSLTTTTYGRPYTEVHEVVQSFTQIVSNHYFIKDRLALFFLGWEDNVESASITYTKKDGSQGMLDLDRQLVNKLCYLLPDEVDSSKPVQLHRTGYIPDCVDKIEFSPISLDNMRLFNADFKQEMKRQFGFDDDIPEKWASTVEEIDLDWNIGSFADLLNLPNLKKLVLGKHRYIRPEMVNDANTAQSKVYEATISNFVLKTLHELNPGFIVERYNKHYGGLKKAAYIKEMGQPSMPDFTYYDLTKLKFKSIPADGTFNSYLQNLTDNNIDTSWEPAGQTELTTYTLELDIRAMVQLNGIKLVQTYFEHENKRAWCPSHVKIRVSEDGDNWEKATYLEDTELGCSTGETNVIPFIAGGKKARFIRLELTTPHAAQTFNISLAEIGLYQ